jgi:hypothetical protein
MFRLLLALAFLGACNVAGSSTTGSTQTGAEPLGADCPTSGEDFETAKLYIEHNATDADTGVHGLFGGEAWQVLCIWDPQGNLILVTRPEGRLGDLTVSDLFFESREPPNEEYTLEQLFADFPEGQYLVGTRGFDGVDRAATATFTHDIPAAPQIRQPLLSEDEESAGDAAVGAGELQVAWDPVSSTVDGASVDISGYEVIVTNVDLDDPNGWSVPVYDVHVGPEVTALTVPAEFFDAATVYELEVLALEVSGNQTISVGFFSTP